MTAMATGILEVGTRDSPILLGINGSPTDSGTVTHNAGKFVKYFLVFDSNGDLTASRIPHLEVHCVQHSENVFEVHNDSGTAVEVVVVAVFEFFSPGVSGFIPSSEVVLGP
jgi:hypothetical protein